MIYSRFACAGPELALRSSLVGVPLSEGARCLFKDYRGFRGERAAVEELVELGETRGERPTSDV